MSLETERREGMGNSRKLESKNWVEESRWRFSRVGWGGGGGAGTLRRIGVQLSVQYLPIVC